MCIFGFTLSTNSKSKSIFFFFAKQSLAKMDNANIAQMKFMLIFERFRIASPEKKRNFPCPFNYSLDM